MKPFQILILLFLIGISSGSRALFAQSAPAGSASSAKGSETKPSKVQGYMGDPAFKRGVELGYDTGIKAGKADKAEKKKSDPARHPAYKEADKKHRSEYGSMAAFVRGYQMGFTKGYTFSYTGRAAPLKAPSMGASSTTGPEAAPAPKSKRYDPAEDAL